MFDAGCLVDDPRPTFVLGSHAGEVIDGQEGIWFRNKAFLEFAKKVSNNDVVESKCFGRFAGHHWTRFRSGHYEVVSGTLCCDDGSETVNHISQTITAQQRAINTMNWQVENDTNFQNLRQCIGDNTTPAIDSLLTMMQQRDWTGSELGLWPSELLEVMRLILMQGLRQPIALRLGQKQLMFYNEGYARLAGARHPHILSVPFSEAWQSELQHRDRLHYKYDTKGVATIDQPYCYDFGSAEDNSLEERYATWTTLDLSPSLHSSLILVSDCTESVLEHRRREVLACLRRECANSSDYLSFCRAARIVSRNFPKDVPFVLLYSAQDDRNAGKPVLEAAYPESAHVVTSDVVQRTLNGATHRDELHLIPADRLPAEWQNLACGHGFGDKTKSAFIATLRSSSEGSHAYCFIIVGLNPRRPLDAAHQAFAESLAREMKCLALSARLREQEARENRSNIQRFRSFSDLIEMTDVGLFEFSIESGKLIRSNDAYHKLSGYPRIPESEQTEFMVMDYIVEEDRERVWDCYKRLLEDHQPSTGEYRYKYSHQNLTEEEKELGGKWVIANYLPLFNDQGKLINVTGCLTDSTAQKRANLSLLRRARALESVKDTEDRFKEFAQSAPCGIYMFNPQSQLTYSNAKFLEMMGASPDINLADFDYPALVYPGDLPEVAEVFATVLKHGKPAAHQFRVNRTWRDPDGLDSPAWLNAVSFAILNEDGTVKNGQGIVFDISSLKWAETAERNSKELALETKRRHAAFVDTASHELRGPLSAVVQCTDIVLESLQQISTTAQSMIDCEPQDSAMLSARLRQEVASSTESMQTIVACSSHQRRLLDDILTLSKLDSRLLEIVPTPVRFVAALTSCVDMFRSLAEAKGVRLEIELDGSLHHLSVDWVSMDSTRVTSMTVNLITNAIKFCANEKLRTVTIKLGASPQPIQRVDNVEFNPKPIDPDMASPEDIWLFCSITDSGIGLSESQQQVLFHRFSQAHAPKTHSKYGGSGLGLYISRSLSELQGGEISVYSAGEGRGSTFAFYIRSKRVAAPVEEINGAAGRNEEVDALKRLNAGRSAGVNVLLVEDNVVNSKVLAQQLKKKGFVVHVAYHGAEALDFLRTTAHWNGNHGGTTVDVILMDAEMPVLDGIGCTRAIRQFENDGQIKSHIPIIAVSANARPEQIQEMMEAGMDESISKPFRIPDLIPKIQKLVTRSSSRKRSTM